MRILLVEDDRMLSDAVARALTQSAHMVQTAAGGRDADDLLASGEYDVVILDLGLPQLDGREVLRRLRRRRSTTPVLVLTVRDSADDVVEALDLGADDHLAKPFELSVLEARVRALLRRANAGATPQIVHGDVRLDVAGRRMFHGGEPIDLSVRELAVAELLLLREGRVVTKQQIAERLYGWEDSASANAVEVLIYRLRRKLEPCGVELLTVRGMGYLIEKARA